MQQERDALIVGAGPAGLALAIALTDAGFTATVLDAQPREALAAPPEDGRDIALTHASVATLRTLGLWQRLRPEEIGCIREARVIDGDRQDAALSFLRAAPAPSAWAGSCRIMRCAARASRPRPSARGCA